MQNPENANLKPRLVGRPIVELHEKSLQALAVSAQTASRPWWAEAFGVGYSCLKLIMAPLKIITEIANAAVAIVFLMLFTVIALCVAGYISEDVIAKFLGELGAKALVILQKSNVL